MQTFALKLSPPTPPWQKRIESRLNRLNKILLLLPRLMPAILLASSASLILVLPGCGGKQVIVQPCPELPPPPKELMQEPPTADLIPTHMRKSVIGSKEIVPKQP